MFFRAKRFCLLRATSPSVDRIHHRVTETRSRQCVGQLSAGARLHPPSPLGRGPGVRVPPPTTAYCQLPTAYYLSSIVKDRPPHHGFTCGELRVPKVIVMYACTKSTRKMRQKPYPVKHLRRVMQVMVNYRLTILDADDVATILPETTDGYGKPRSEGNVKVAANAYKPTRHTVRCGTLRIGFARVR